MATENVSKKTVTVSEGLKKGTVGTGKIVRVTDGLASDFMTEDQIIKRQVSVDDPFTEIEICIKGTFVTKTMKDYTRIGSKLVPAASTMGRIASVCELAEDAEIPMTTKEIETRNGKLVVWDIAI